jgi:L-ascorbate metabolism protein UlaG (beta-lactamase superfamily)
MSLKITGKLPSGKQRERILRSANYTNGAFQNLSPTPMKPEGVSYWKMMREFFKKHPETAPPSILPFVRTDLAKLTGTEPLIVWFGHSSYLLRIENRHFLVDPVFSGNAAPLSFMVKAFPGSNEYKTSDLPYIDYLILTHDHYDHLDFKTIRALKDRVNKIYCSLGVGAHLVYWGIDEAIITEMDWWDVAQPDDRFTLTATPARHFSGRGIKRAQSLWSSFILQAASHTIYLGGDSGYDSHFREIGEQYGPFDLAILEAGQYNDMWPLIHMMPEETVQAAADLKAKALMPVHWGKFRLSMHPWNEPVKRIMEKAQEYRAQENKIHVVVPMIGEPLVINGNYKLNHWWQI